MRALIIVPFFVCLSVLALGQEKKIDKSKVPVKVIDYLLLNYPVAKEYEYYQKKDKDSVYYEVEFELAKQEYNLKFSLSGSLLETEREIDLEDIEPAIRQSMLTVLEKSFRKYRIKKLQEVNPGSEKQFELNVRIKKTTQYKSGFYDILFDSSGQVISIEEEKLYSIESVF